MRKSGEARSNKRRFGSGKGKGGGGGGGHGPTPRRGPPAIFVTCEGGRERKCRREALDLIHHYYYSSPSSSRPNESSSTTEGIESSPSATNGQKTTTANGDDERQRDRRGPLGLEEELAMLREGAAAEEVLNYENHDSKRPRRDGSDDKKGSMKSPFSVYDVGVRGTVCIVCTLPGCEMVPYDEILAEIKSRKEEEEETTATSTTGDDDDGAAKGDAKGKEGDDAKKKKGKYEKGDAADRERKRFDRPADYEGPPLWDAVETVRCIMRDAKRETTTTRVDDDATNEDAAEKSAGEGGAGAVQKEATSGGSSEGRSSSSASVPPPGSRFVVKMIPVQATCYASAEEIKAVSASLLKRCLPAFPSVCSKREGEAITFKIEIKRRLTSHLTRDEVIEALAPMVLAGLPEVLPGRTFEVDLTDPDFSIRVETCKGLCGVSVLPRAEWHGKFNLAELTDPSKADEK